MQKGIPAIYALADVSNSKYRGFKMFLLNLRLKFLNLVKKLNQFYKYKQNSVRIWNIFTM